MPGAITLTAPDNGMGLTIMPVAVNVLINNKPAAHLGSFVTGHPGPPKFHPPNPIVLGNPKVLINMKPAAFMGCPNACRHMMISTSPNVLIG